MTLLNASLRGPIIFMTTWWRISMNSSWDTGAQIYLSFHLAVQTAANMQFWGRRIQEVDLRDNNLSEASAEKIARVIAGWFPPHSLHCLRRSGAARARVSRVFESWTVIFATDFTVLVLQRKSWHSRKSITPSCCREFGGESGRGCIR